MRLDPLPSPLLEQDRSSRLLTQAYELMQDHKSKDAEEILDALLLAEPQNVEVWEAYMQLRRDSNELNWLRERILHTQELSEEDKKDILAYHDYLFAKLKQAEPQVETPAPAYSLPTQTQNILIPLEEPQFIPLEIDSPDIQDELVVSRPRTMVFEYMEDAVKLHDAIIQPVQIEKQSLEFDFIRAFDLSVLKSRHILAGCVVTVFLIGLRLIAQDHFFGYWMLLGSLMTLLYWFIIYSNEE